MTDVHDNTNNMRSSEQLAHLYTAVHSETEHEQVEDAENFREDNEDHDTRQDLQQFGIYRSLPVYGQPDFSTKEPQSAEEYIRRVRHEAAKLPDVVTSTIDPRHYDEARTSYGGSAAGDIPQSQPWAMPARQWIVQMLEDFVAVRCDLARCEEAQDYENVQVPGENDHGSWSRFCLGASGSGGRQPTLPVLLSIDQVNCNYLLAWHTRWAMESGTLNSQNAMWLYAITARLQRPITQGAMGSLRALLRHCAALRAVLPSAQDPLLPTLNILIAITGAFFGQDETLAGTWEETKTLTD